MRASQTNKQALKTIVMLGDYPVEANAEQALLQTVGSILRFHHPDDWLMQFTPVAPLPVHGLLCGIHHRLQPKHLDCFPQLQVVSNYGAGIDHLPLSYLAERGILLTNTPDLLTDATADLALALLLLVARRIPEAQQAVQQGHFKGWHPAYLLSPGLQGKTLGIVGLGRIGQAMAKRAVSCGMRVLYTQRQPFINPDALPFPVQYCDKATLLSQSDVLSFHCPLTETTYHWLDAVALKQVRRGVIVINTARGGVLEESAVIAAVQSGQIGGVGLDVFEGEPTLNPAWANCPNTVILPHIGSNTLTARQAMGTRAYDNLRLALQGEAPLSPVMLLHEAPCL